MEPCIFFLHLDAGLVETVVAPGGTDGNLGVERVVDLVGLGVGQVLDLVGLGVGLVVEIVGLVIGIMPNHLTQERLGFPSPHRGVGL